ncbi:MAG: DNA primase [Chitinophagales bacterium]
MISRETIEKINDAAYVEDVVGEFVHLKKRGANLLGLCPFHDEKTPSFIVSPAKGIYKCFGCGKSGDSIKFIMEHEHYSYPQALKFLAEKYSIAIEEKEVSPEEKKELDKKESLFIVLKYAAEFFKDRMLNSDDGRAIGLSYFKERGFLEETLDTFDLGYSPDKWDDLYQDAIKKGYNEEYLIQAGLIKKKDDGKVFDFFRGRVMFPIHNVSGKPVAFGGRVLKKTEKSPKYINTAETDVYHKSKLVYGIFQAKQEIRKLDETYLVEGYTDVISLHQAGIKNVVASSGTSLTPDQVRLIRRFSPNITLLYDGDKAGIKAAIRGVDILLEQDANVRVIQLPDGEDPDSYLQSIGSEAFKAYLDKEKQDFVLFKLTILLEDGKNDPLKKAAIIKDIALSISKIKDSIKRAVYVKECSQLLEINEKLLISETNKLRRSDVKNKAGQQDQGYQPIDELEQAVDPSFDHQQKEVVQNFEPQEREIIRILLQYGGQELADGKTVTSLVLEILEDLELNHSVYSYIQKAYKEALANGNELDMMNAFKSHQEQEIRDVCLDILAPSHEISHNWTEMHDVIVTSFDADLNRIAKEVAMRYKSKRLIDMLKMLDENLKTESDYERQKKMLIFRQKFEKAKNELHEQLGTDVLY